MEAVCVKCSHMLCAVNSKGIDESRSDWLKLDDDNEFPAIGRSAFIY